MAQLVDPHALSPSSLAKCALLPSVGPMTRRPVPMEPLDGLAERPGPGENLCDAPTWASCAATTTDEDLQPSTPPHLRCRCSSGSSGVAFHWWGSDVRTTSSMSTLGSFDSSDISQGSSESATSDTLEATAQEFEDMQDDVDQRVAEPRSDKPSTGSTDFAVRGAALLVVLAICCGCACQAPYEVMNSRSKGCAPLVSLVEHLFAIAASAGAMLRPRCVSWRVHLALGAASLAYTLLLNVALGSALPMTALVAMKNGNLAANMLLGVSVMRYRYSVGQYLGVACITCGLLLTSFAGAHAAPGQAQDGGSGFAGSAGLGIACLLGALLSRAASGILQEVCCPGAPVTELLFFRHVFGLPVLLFQWPQIVEHARRWSLEADAGGLAFPTMWLLLAVNIVFDYATKLCMSHLIARASSLTATLVLTVQRFVAFCISATLLSREAAGAELWLGTVTVVGGAFIYTLAQQPPKADRLALRKND